jgi:EAL domain-containing protein (putative c-di-GMP-specific phosphodiesterase class I)/DNA-binding NarL/FixJ family response regulator
MVSGKTVLVADDNVLVRDLLEAVLAGTDEFSIVASAEDARGAGREAAAHRPALALVDVRMPGGGPAATRAIHEASPDTRVIALSSSEDATSVRLMLGAGAVSYVVKGTPAGDLLGTMRAALAPAPVVAEPRPAGPPRRVLLALTDPIVLDELAEAVMAGEALQLVGLAQTAYHAVSLAARLRPDVAVVDAGMSSGGARVAAGLIAASPSTRVIAWASGREEAPASEIVITGGDPAVALLEAIERGDGQAGVVLLRGPGVSPHLAGRRSFERLASVLSSGAVDVQLQPIVGLTDDRAHGYEALARFPGHPDPGPDWWFAEAHRSEVGIELERLAVRSGLEQVQRLPERTFLAVNVSPDTVVSPGLREDLEGVDVGRIVLELTEHAPVRDYDELKRALDDLRGLGARIAVDDCGAGFTSLRHVALIAPDFLKLDMVLCRDVREPARAALARALVSFARETGSVVIAEGIEERDDLAALRDLGVGLGQGFLLSRPQKPELLSA